MKKIRENLNDQNGVAILMVIAAIAILTFVMADFTFETKLNKIKAYNQIEKDQARLVAEAGMNFARAKLKLYQIGRNYLEKTDSLKGVVNPSDIESIVTMPFAYPLPENLAKNLIQKTAIKDFKKTMILDGELILTVTPVSGFLNPNNMRLRKADEKKNEEEEQDNSSFDENDENEKLPPQAYIEKKLLDTLTSAFEEKKENDDEFDALYGNLEPKMLIKELKFFVNHPDDFKDAEKNEIEALYQKAGSTPKHAPMTSVEEMYLLEGWSDDIIDLIKDRIATHQVTIIPVNKITDEQLKILFPNITDVQLEEFFKYRDGDEELKEPPKEFKNAADFKNLIVGRLAVVTTAEYEERAKEFENAGLRIGVAGKLYKIESTGKFKRATYKLVAYVDLPIKPDPIKKKEDKDKDKEKDEKEEDDENVTTAETDPEDDKEDEEKEKEKKLPLQLMNPRVVETRAN